MKNLAKSSRAILAENVGRIRQPKESEAALGKRLGISQRTTNRILDASYATKVDTLDKMAARLCLQPWQLLVPGLDINNPPVIAALTKDERDLYLKISEKAKKLGISIS